MTEAALNVQGAGWGAMAWEPLGQRLIVEQVYDRQGNVGNGAVPLLVLDMWEHAYYLQYENAKADWVTKYLVSAAMLWRAAIALPPVGTTQRSSCRLCHPSSGSGSSLASKFVC